MKFKHVLPALDVTIYDAPMEWTDENCDMPHGDATINFTVDIDSRGYGIRDINTWVNSIAISIGDDDFVFEDVINGWTIDVESDMSNGRIMVREMDIDYKLKSITVFFQ